jgi:hypothetical protein
MKTIVIVPTKNEYDNICKLMTWYTEKESDLKNKTEIRIVFLIVDDSDMGEYKKLERHLSMYKWARCIEGDNGYKNSVVYGIISSLKFKPDSIIVMDADHPYNSLIKMIRSLMDNDVVVGCDDTNNIQRVVTNFLCNKLLKMGLNHPTCGFWGFNMNVINKIKPWKVKSDYDVSHVEWLLRSRREGLKIGQVPFISYVKHGYNIKRYFRWLYDFIRIMFI